MLDDFMVSVESQHQHPSSNSGECSSHSEPKPRLRKIPEWIKAPIPTGEKYHELKETIQVAKYFRYPPPPLPLMFLFYQSERNSKI